MTVPSLMPPADGFRRALVREFDEYLDQQERRFAAADRLRIDLHCHDHNSDVPDELWGRILGLPETWLSTSKLVKRLRAGGSDVITVTNHNNARSCWHLLEQGLEVLVGAEFTCHFEQHDLFCHVLSYGFTPEQEVVLNRKRQDIQAFLRYAAEQDIPVILPHPLYLYSRNNKIDLDLFEKLAVMFQRFEVLNGQRDLWQSTLTLHWARGLTAEKIAGYARKHRLNPAEFGVDPYRPKVLAGGSDDHMGIFAGQCGSYLEVPDLARRLETTSASDLALEAIRDGRIAPFGHVAENSKLNIALLDYFAQIATRLRDPGLLRILLHRGDVQDKVACFAISNLLLELQKHKQSSKFFRFVHDALHGKKPGRMLRWKIARDYRFCVEQLERIADNANGTPEAFVATVDEALSALFTGLSRLIVQRVEKSSLVAHGNRLDLLSTEEFTKRFEIPSQITALFFGGSNRSDMSGFNVRGLLDNLSFPILISTVLTGATLASTRMLYQNRDFLNRFAAHIGNSQHPRRALHLTDTLFDRNGVSNSLSGKLREFQRHDLAIDLLTCHADAQGQAHLHVVRPLATYTLPDSQQELRLPDLMEIVRIFYEGGYDRVVCSTEGPMVAVALFLKYKFNVPCYFFMHTDWLEYVQRTTGATQHERDRLRRALRQLYRQFDGVFVLNSDHRDWLSGHEMEIPAQRVHLTAHHAPAPVTNVKPASKRSLFPDATPQTPVLLIACRVSREKGLFDLPEILAMARQALPDLRLVIAGTGPAEQELRERLPDARFLGWVDRDELAGLYRGLDLFVFPSRFDTFGNVLLEAFAHGMPAVAYNCKGPKDIIENGRSGYLVEDARQMAECIVAHFRRSDEQTRLRNGALARAARFSAGTILARYMTDLGLPSPYHTLVQRSVA